MDALVEIGQLQKGLNDPNIPPVKQMPIGIAFAQKTMSGDGEWPPLRRTKMKTKLLALLLLAGSAAFAGPRFFFGVGVGPGFGYYSAPPPVAYAPPPVAYAPAPGPGYAWIGGYYYPVGANWYWRAGYWAPRPFAGAVWVAPRYYGGRFYAGHWRR